MRSGQNCVNAANPRPVATIRPDHELQEASTGVCVPRGAPLPSVSAAEPSRVTVTTTPIRISLSPTAVR